MEASAAGDGPREPTFDDVNAIMSRALAAAERAENAAKVHEDAQRAAATETRQRFPELPKDMVDQISRASAQQVVAMLRKEFELSQQQQPAAEPETPAEEAPAPEARSIASYFIR